MLQRAIAKGGSVCPSVRRSVTLVIHVETVQYIVIHFTLHDRAMFLVFSERDAICHRWSVCLLSVVCLSVVCNVDAPYSGY